LSTKNTRWGKQAFRHPAKARKTHEKIWFFSCFFVFFVDRFFYRLRILLLLPIGALALSACSPLAALSSISGSHIQQSATHAYGNAPRQTLDVHLPQDAQPNADVVLFIYGGRWQFGSKDEYRFVADGLAQSGFITVIPDYRLYPQVDWRDFLADSAAAYHWVEAYIAGFGGNPQRIFVMGHSAGAHMAAMVALDPKLQRHAGVKRRENRSGSPAPAHAQVSARHALGNRFRLPETLL